MKNAINWKKVWADSDAWFDSQANIPDWNRQKDDIMVHVNKEVNRILSDASRRTDNKIQHANKHKTRKVS